MKFRKEDLPVVANWATAVSPSERTGKRAGINFLSSTGTVRGLASLADQGVVSATNFVTGVIVGRTCTKEEFGLYMLGFTIVLFGKVMQTSLISSPYTVYSSRLEVNLRSQYLGSTLIHQLALGSLAVFVLIIGWIVLSGGIGPNNLARLLGVLAMVILFIMLREHIRRVYFADLQMKAALCFDLFIAVTQTGCFLLLAYLGLLSARLAYWVIGIVCGIASLGWMISRRKALSLGIEQALSDLHLNWAFGWWVFGGNLLHLTSVQLYPWFLTFSHGTAAAGVFAACWSVTALVNPLLIGIGNFLGPRTAHAHGNGISDLCQVVHKATIFLVVATGIFFVALHIFGDKLVVLIYGSKYAGDGGVVSIFALSIVASSVSLPASYGLWAMERPEVNFKVNIIALGTALTLGLWFVNMFGVVGVGYGLLVGNTIASMVRCMIFRREVCATSA